MRTTKGKQKITTKPEVLSPVGSKEMLTAAVRSGADAVYMGFSDFNARRNADNFDAEEFTAAVKYCKERGVKVYLTLNTLLSDDELPRALRVASIACSAGADAAIVQDLGLARLLNKRLPQLPLHASTQLTAHSKSALPFLKELGFCRVVASREMSREELRVFTAEAKKLGMSVEVFVHGALCMCMSGQCYLSAMLGGRSGNRGLCAGPCRLPFKVEGGTGYDLSLKDLSLVEHIGELADMGVESLKIEGRMKRPEYVAAATAVCRKTVDGEDCEELKDTLCKVFSRSGFTSGYFENKLGPDMFGIRTKEDVMLSSAVMSSLHELYRHERQSVKITGEFSMPCAGEPATLTVSDGENTVTVSGGAAEIAKNKPADREFLISKLEKTGGTPFYFDNITVSLGEGLAIGGGLLGELRREALEKLLALRGRGTPAEIDCSVSVDAPKKVAPSLIVVFSSLSQLPEDLSGLSAVAVPIESAIETLSLPLPVYVTLPRGIMSEEYLLERLKKAKEHGIEYALCGNIAECTLCKKTGIKPWFDFSMNIYNSQSAAAAAALGAEVITLSAEARCDMLGKIYSPVPTAFIAYGRLPLMLTRNCPQKNGSGCSDCRGEIVDRKGIAFPIRCRSGYSELYNSRPIYLAERMDEFPLSFGLLYFTIEGREECAEIIDAYKKGIPPKGDYTRGLYYRGVE